MAGNDPNAPSPSAPLLGYAQEAVNLDTSVLVEIPPAVDDDKWLAAFNNERGKLQAFQKLTVMLAQNTARLRSERDRMQQEKAEQEAQSADTLERMRQHLQQHQAARAVASWRDMPPPSELEVERHFRARLMQLRNQQVKRSGGERRLADIVKMVRTKEGVSNVPVSITMLSVLQNLAKLWDQFGAAVEDFQRRIRVLSLQKVRC